MARRARKGVEHTQIIIIAAIVLAIGGAAVLIASRSSDKFAGLTPLPLGEFSMHGNSLSGNIYKLEGKIIKKERFTANNGQMIIVELDDGSQMIDVGVFVPVELYGTNLDRGDAITARVEVRGGGILALQEIE